MFSSLKVASMTTFPSQDVARPVVTAESSCIVSSYEKVVLYWTLMTIYLFFPFAFCSNNILSRMQHTL